ncbi:MAG TPA: DUF4244 domain-containing protein [Actinomycetota bacterium]|nr:DUF4244 domain-containing protein [Actinomycetota bacterium]
MEVIRNLQTRIYNGLCRLKWESGQTTAEYALVLLAAAAVAIVLIQWASGNSTLEEFFNGVIAQVQENAGIGDGGGGD